MAFTNPYSVQRGAMATTAIAGVVMHNAMMGMIEGIRAARIARQEEQAYHAWDTALGEARHSAAQMSDLAKAAVTIALDAQDEADVLRAEVARLRRAVDQRDSAIRSLAA